MKTGQTSRLGKTFTLTYERTVRISSSERNHLTMSLLGKPERRREFVQQGLNNVQKAFADHDLVANVRLETYEGERYFDVPPTNK